MGNGSNAPATVDGTSTLTYYDAAGNSLGHTAPSAAGNYIVAASFAPSTGNSAAYTGAFSQPLAFTISPAAPALSLTAFSTVVLTAANGSNVSSLDQVSPKLNYFGADGTALGATVPTATGNYVAVATFAGSANYTSAVSQPYAFTVGQPSGTPPAVDVSAAGGTYDGSPFTATATVTGPGAGAVPEAWLENVGTTVTYYDATGASLGSALPTSAGSYFAVASFAGSADYAPAAGAAPFTIAPAATTVTVSDDGGTYNATAYPATAQVAGVAGADPATPSTLEGVTATSVYFDDQGNDLGMAAPTDAGNYTVVTLFAGSANQTPATTSAAFTVEQATPTFNFTGSGGQYTGNAYTSAADVQGVGGADLGSASISYSSGTAPKNAGAYTATANYTGGNKNYAAASATTMIAISPQSSGSFGAGSAGSTGPSYLPGPANSNVLLGFALSDPDYWDPTGAGSLGGSFGKVPTPAGMLAVTSDTTSTPNGGQFAAPGQSGLVAPTGALATLATSPSGINGLTTQANGVPYIVPTGGGYSLPTVSTPGFNRYMYLGASGDLLMEGAATIVYEDAYTTIYQDDSSGTTSTSTPVDNGDGTITTTVVTVTWDASWKEVSTLANVGVDQNGHPQYVSNYTKDYSMTYDVTSTATTVDALGNQVSRDVATETDTGVYHYSDAGASTIYDDVAASTLSVTIYTTASDLAVIHQGNANPNVPGVTQDLTVQSDDTHSDNYTYDQNYHYNDTNGLSLFYGHYHGDVADTHAKTVQGGDILNDPASGDTGQETLTYTGELRR